VSAAEETGVTVSLRGKVALVTGGSGGIGAAVVEWLSRAGAEVISVDLPDAVPPREGHAVACDLMDPAAIRDLGERLAEDWPRLHILVHCAGITRDGVLWKLPEEDWNQVLRVNLDAAFHLLRVVVPLMRRADEGSVVLLSSINGERGKFGQASYAASKAGLIGLAKTAARELGAFGIRVNSIAPGMIRTPMTEHLSQEVVQRAVDESVLGRLGEPRDVAAAVLFLCSDLSTHVTGQVLRVDGGQCMA
jgi:acetoacetyl-CoA reductase/3-oxoacyl-[acyl-carrier protein] reductase